MRLIGQRTRAASFAAVIAAGGLIAVAFVWSISPDDKIGRSDPAVALPAAGLADETLPAPRSTSSAQLAATLRAHDRPPSPELLRDNPQAQAAYDASAQSGDFVTPPSVSVEH